LEEDVSSRINRRGGRKTVLHKEKGTSSAKEETGATAFVRGVGRCPAVRIQRGGGTPPEEGGLPCLWGKTEKKETTELSPQDGKGPRRGRPNRGSIREVRTRQQKKSGTKQIPRSRAEGGGAKIYRQKDNVQGEIADPPNLHVRGQ